MGRDLLAVFERDVEHQPLFDDRQRQLVGPAGMADRLEVVFLQEIENRDRAFVLDIGRGPADALVEFDIARPEFALAHC